MISDRWGGHIYVTNRKDQTNHAQVRDIFNSLISLDKVETNQNSRFFCFWGKMIAFKDLLISEKEA